MLKGGFQEPVLGGFWAKGLILHNLIDSHGVVMSWGSMREGDSCVARPLAAAPLRQPPPCENRLRLVDITDGEDGLHLARGDDGRRGDYARGRGAGVHSCLLR